MASTRLREWPVASPVLILSTHQMSSGGTSTHRGACGFPCCDSFHTSSRFWWDFHAPCGISGLLINDQSCWQSHCGSQIEEVRSPHFTTNATESVVVHETIEASQICWDMGSGGFDAFFQERKCHARCHAGLEPGVRVLPKSSS